MAALGGSRPPVAVTKLHAPRGRPGLVTRDDLVATLAGGAGTRLTLVTGPAGAGKTTLVAQWHASALEDRPFAWLSLDPEDADPVRFWACVVEALRTVHDGFGVGVLGALRAGRADLRELVVPAVVNELAARETPVVLVLDDLHALGEAPEVEASLGALLDRAPPELHVAVATRTTPSLPIGRLRARGELTELDAVDLRFDVAEADALLRQGFGIVLDAGQVERLHARTEGWAAGLQLAGGSLRRRASGFDAFMSAFGGGGPELLGYLTGELLDAQPQALREFLLRTSILERLSPPLCDAVLGGNAGEARIEELDRRNLMIVALDPERRWWRYHQLFAELLRRELARVAAPEEIVALHARAAAWHREHGTPSEAIGHALAAGDTGGAAALVAEHWEETFNRGELTVVAGWLDALPPGAVVRDPRLWLARLWIAIDRGRLLEVERHLAEAGDDAPAAARAWASVLRMLHAFKRGDLELARRMAEPVARQEGGDAFLDTVSELVRGVTAYWSGDAAQARPRLEAASRLAGTAGNRLGHVYAEGCLALLALDRGDRRDAERHVAAVATAREEDPATGEHFVAFAAELARGRLQEQAGAYDAAAGTLARAVALSRRGAGLLEIAAALLALAALEEVRGGSATARAAADEAEAVLAECPAPGILAERSGARRRTPQPGEALSPGELAVLGLLPTDLTQREIGEQLFISLNTVKTHCRNIYAKLRAGSREQAVGRARELGYL